MEVNMGIVIPFAQFKKKKDQARFYWRMTKCSYRELARHIGVSLDQARRWELQFVKEKEKEKKNGKRKRT